jgi:arsenite/tail-anchored protein-transporting ATPase
MSPPSRLPLGRRRILFVGGKGGVGKTTVAGALSLGMAEEGERVLLVSTDPAHSLADLFDTPIGDELRELAPGLHALEIDPDRQVRGYLAEVRRNLKAFVRPAMYPEVDRHLELSRHAPGAIEAALLDRVADLMADREGAYDRIVFDTAPTGHTLRLLALPELMQAWTDGLLRSRERSDIMRKGLERLQARDEGDDLSWFKTPEDGPKDARSTRIREVLLERRRKFARARRVILDPEATAFLLVLIPERLPILESRRALETLREHRVPVAGVVVNRVLPREGEGEFLEGRREEEARYLDQIEREFGSLPRVRIPYLARDVDDLAGLREIAAYLR